MSVFVTATTQRKRAEMERVFGTDQIPVTHRAPSLSPAGCLARRDGLTPAHARVLVMAGLPIAASEVSLVQEIEQERGKHPAPVFVSPGRVIQPGLFLC